jgi:hypothetical protein
MRTVRDEAVIELRALLEAPALRARPVDPDPRWWRRPVRGGAPFLGLYDRYFDRVPRPPA